MMSGTDIYRSWGRPTAPSSRGAVRLRWRDEALPADAGPLLPYGNGRSYGDSCLNPDGSVIDARGLDRFIVFDRRRGVLRCEGGVLLSEILRIVVPHGWFLPVTPGTQFITLGGAIANDVHGKNHHHAGSFGHHVRCFELLRSDGTRLLCSPEENPDWFGATIGGLGLTGLILWAEIALEHIAGEAIEAETIRFSHIDEFFDLSRSSHNAFEYTAAWIDSMQPTRRGTRGLFFRGNHAPSSTRRVRPPRRKPPVPFTPAFSLLPRPAVVLFNAMTYHRPRPVRSLTHYEQFLYPLDAVPHWNRLFGRRGFYQHQSVIPGRHAREVVCELIDAVAQSGAGSALAVLKVFGDHRPRGWLSFSRPGVTLALDVPDQGADTIAVLDRLDAITLQAGGAVYPAKDARMSPSVFRRGFPRWRELDAYRDPAFMSGLWRRVTGAAA